MPYDIAEIAADLPAALGLYSKLKAAIGALPATEPKKMVDYSAVIVAVLPDLAKLIDTVIEQGKT